ncbi:MAG: MBL fold metallo-hydrolase [Myxococcaceae bacterium]|nr:MBL fold metallo-hydrolase [Myxococcaceae bacterium]
MKSLHRSDLFGWSRFDEARDLDFNSVVWVRPEGNVVFDPLELSPHDAAHLTKLGGAAAVVLTNSEHVRAAAALQAAFGARVYGPRGEREKFPLACDRWLSHGEEVVPGLESFELDGSKTPGELALLLDGTTLITGDLIRAQRAGRLNLLPDAKLKDKAKALASVKALLEAAPKLDAVLVGDGWPVFRDGRARLLELVAQGA